MQPLVSNQSPVVRILCSAVQIGETLLAAFAGQEEESQHQQDRPGRQQKQLDLDFLRCTIDDYTLLGRTLRENPFLRTLTVGLPSNNRRRPDMIFMLDELAGHPIIVSGRMRRCQDDTS